MQHLLGAAWCLCKMCDCVAHTPSLLWPQGLTVGTAHPLPPPVPSPNHQQTGSRCVSSTGRRPSCTARCLQHWDAVLVGGTRARPHLLLLMVLLLTHPLWLLLVTVRQQCRKTRRLLCRQQHEGSLAVTESV